MITTVVLFILIISGYLLLTQTTNNSTVRQLIQLTSRPNKFISNGDVLDLGTVPATTFSLSFICKINILKGILATFSNLPLTLADRHLSFNGEKHRLEQSLYRTAKWVNMVITAGKTSPLIVNVDEKYYLFPWTGTPTVNLQLGSREFDGSFANIVVNDLPVYQVTLENQTCSAAGVVDLSFFHQNVKIPAKDLNRRCLPWFQLSENISFSLNVSVKIFQDGVLFTVRDKTGNKIAVGRNIGASESQSGTTNVDFADLAVKPFDMVTIVTSSVRPDIMFIKNVSSQKMVDKQLFPPMNGSYSLQPGNPAIGLITDLSHCGRNVWHTGISFLEQNGFKHTPYMSLQGLFVGFKSPACEKTSWDCLFRFQPANENPLCFFSMTAKNQRLYFELSHKTTPKTAVATATVTTTTISVTHQVSSKKKNHTYDFTFKGIITITLKQLFNGKMCITLRRDDDNHRSRWQTISVDDFLPEIKTILSECYIRVGAMDPSDESPSPSSHAGIHLYQLDICSIPFRMFDGKTVVKDTRNITNCILSTEVEFYKDVFIFSVTINNKIISLFIRSRNLYLKYNDIEYLIDKKLAKMTGNYQFHLLLNPICHLFVTNPKNESISYRFRPNIKYSSVITMALSDKPILKASVLGHVCCM